MSLLKWRSHHHHHHHYCHNSHHNHHHHRQSLLVQSRTKAFLNVLHFLVSCKCTQSCSGKYSKFISLSGLLPAMTPRAISGLSSCHIKCPSIINSMHMSCLSPLLIYYSHRSIVNLCLLSTRGVRVLIQSFFSFFFLLLFFSLLFINIL